MSYKKKIRLLSNLLKKKGCNYYLLPRTDKFLNEFISEEDERVKWLTGFTGSFAFVIISLKIKCKSPCSFVFFTCVLSSVSCGVTVKPELEVLREPVEHKPN